jgi:hypothetical protein
LPLLQLLVWKTNFFLIKSDFKLLPGFPWPINVDPQQ